MKRHTVKYRVLTPAQVKREQSLAIAATCAALIAFFLLLIAFGVVL